MHAKLTREWLKDFGKPVVNDEPEYEGNVVQCWGSITAQELVHRFWITVMRGGYAGHGETYSVQQQGDGLSLAVGRESIPDMDGDRIFWLTYDSGDGKGKQMADAFLSDPLWVRLGAVEAGRVHAVDDGIWATAGGWFAAQAMLDDLAAVYGVTLPLARGAGR